VRDWSRWCLSAQSVQGHLYYPHGSSVGDYITVELGCCNCWDSVMQSTVSSQCELVRMRVCSPCPYIFVLKSECHFAVADWRLSML